MLIIFNHFFIAKQVKEQDTTCLQTVKCGLTSDISLSIDC